MKSFFEGQSLKECMARIQTIQEQNYVYISLCAFIFGLTIAIFVGFAPEYLLPLSVAAAVIVVISVLSRMPAFMYAVFLLVGVMWGGLDALQTDSFSVPPDEAVHFSGKVVEVSANEENYFSQLAEYVSDTHSFIMCGHDDEGWRGRLMIIGSPVEVRPGDELELTAIVRNFQKNNNFNIVNNNYLRNNGIAAVALVVPQSMRFSKLASPYTPLNLGLALKDKVYKSMELLPSMQQALLKGIGFGETGMLTNGKKAVLQQTGIMHIFAVSGLHISYVMLLSGAVFEFIRKRLRLSYKFVIISSMAVVIFFCLVVGLTPSVLRAGCMSIAALLSVLWLREHTASRALIIAAFLMLLFRPRWLCQPGFIMSFLATAGIIFTVDYWRMLIPNRALATCFAAQLMVMPVVAYFFNTISLIGLFISPFIALGAGVVVIMVLLSMLLAPLGLGLIALSGAGLLAEIMYNIAEIFAGLPGAFTYTGSPGLVTIVIYYLLLFVAYFILARYKYERQFNEELPSGKTE